jgi:hypothetical protein
MGRYIKLAEAAGGRDSGAATMVGPSARLCGFRTTDPYKALAKNALQSICLSYPAGMVEWLQHARPELYLVLTARMPREIEELWDSRAPVNAFQYLLDQYLRVFRLACLQFQANQACLSTQGLLSAETLKKDQQEDGPKETADAT